jgi:hypothetical protein
MADTRADEIPAVDWVRHTMHLTMVLAHLGRVTNEETDEAKRMIDKADAQLTKGQP